MTAFIFLLTVVCGGIVIWACLCRINTLKPGVTQPVVFWQHASLASGIFISMLVPVQYGKLCVLAGLTVFFVAGAWRWRHGAPEGVLIESGDS